MRFTWTVVRFLVLALALLSAAGGGSEQQSAIAQQREALRRFRALGDRAGQAEALSSLGSLQKPEESVGRFLSVSRVSAKRTRRLTGGRSGSAPPDPEEEAGDLRGATESYARVLALSKASGSPSNEAVALLGIARIHRRQGDLAGARQAAESALDLVEAMRVGTARPGLRVSFFAGKQGVLRGLHRSPDGSRPARAGRRSRGAGVRGERAGAGARPARSPGTGESRISQAGG